MLRVRQPNRSAGWTYSTCIRRVRSAPDKERLESIKPDIVAASAQLVAAADAGRISSIPPTAGVGGVSTEELSAIYSLRLARLGSAGRMVYDELLAAPRNGRCPLCGHGQVSTLDHFLPKSRFPALAVAPLNLVPACFRCNQAKGDRSALLASDVTLHPYFDDVEGSTWLCASVLHDRPPALQFAVVGPPQWSAVLRARVEHHFNVFRLGSLFAALAAEELLSIQYELGIVFDSSGANGVTDHLKLQAQSRGVARTNSWQTATYTALSGCTWFCRGGFR